LIKKETPKDGGSRLLLTRSSSGSNSSLQVEYIYVQIIIKPDTVRGINDTPAAAAINANFPICIPFGEK